MSNFEVKLIANNKLISGFNISELSFCYYNLANKAVFEFNNKESQELLKVRNSFKKQDDAKVFVGKSLKISGYISDVITSYSEDSEPFLRIIILSEAGKYVKNAVDHGKTFLKQKVSNIVRAICPDIKVNANADKILSKFIVYGSENINSVIARLYRKSGLLIYSGVDGIEISSKSVPSSNVGYIVTGENILDVRILNKEDEGIILSGQKVFDDNVSIKDAVCSRLESPGFKKKYIYGDDVSIDGLKASNNKGKEVSAVIPSWLDMNGEFLSLNSWLKVQDSWFSLDDKMLLFSLVFRLDSSGYQAFVELEKND